MYKIQRNSEKGDPATTPLLRSNLRLQQLYLALSALLGPISSDFAQPISLQEFEGTELKKETN